MLLPEMVIDLLSAGEAVPKAKMAIGETPFPSISLFNIELLLLPFDKAVPAAVLITTTPLV